ncbi:MAG TPA: 8-amino-7-oxononanoate synthase [Methylophilaceae bacterium]|nr:8-amino-7-oxononanoate synthase [Methylophilaceae bacterium]
MNLLAELQAELDQRAAQGLLRKRRLLQSAQSARIKADSREVLSFCSNDYLGLADHPALKAAMQEAVAQSGVGSGASHLITGHHQYHEQLETALAAFVGLPAALLFSTGYMANLGIISALMRRGDAIFADKLNHASLNDAAVLSRGELHRYPHNDMAALEGMLKASSAPRKLVVADAVFSMDGDLAPVPELLALCERYDACLLLDDAHGFGVLGEKGQGILSHFAVASPRIIYMATLGKAAGVAGAFVGGETVLIDYLVQNARTYIYTTAAPPALSATLLAALKIIEHEDQRRAHLQALIAFLKANLKPQRWQLMESATAIQPLVIGSNEAALQLSEYLLGKGILVPAIRPPTVPKGSARLRISLSAAHSLNDVKQLIDTLHEAEKAAA